MNKNPVDEEKSFLEMDRQGQERQPTLLYSIGQILEPTARYELMAQPLYGFDCYGNRIKPEAGYVIVPEGDRIGNNDKPWDVFAGWMKSDGYDAEMGHQARSKGRWTCWERPVAGGIKG